MTAKEYLQTFSNEGDTKVTVKFGKNSALIAPQRMSASELVALIDPLTGNFLTEMRFDDHPFQIRKLEIDPQQNTLTIHLKD